MAKQNKLDEEVKLFIVQCLACYDTPSQVAEAVKEQFDIAIERQNVMTYDPTKSSGKALKQELREVFEKTREAFLAESMEIPIASKMFRLRALQRSYYFFVGRNNHIAANGVLEQVAKEMGGYYTNKLIHGGDTVNPLIMWLQQIGGTSIPVVQNPPDDDDDYIEGVLVQPADQAPAKSAPKWRKPINGGD
jgi:hypothetical protein